MDTDREKKESDHIALLRGWAQQAAGRDIDLAGGFETFAAQAEALTEIRWQETIDKIVSRVYPKRDGSGSDGDALALTCDEIGQAFNHLQEQIDERDQTIARIRGDGQCG